MKSTITVLLALLAWNISASAQQVFVSGLVKDAKSGEPVLFANVFLAEMPSIGTTTDELGFFQIRVDLKFGKRLEASGLGYTSQSLPLTGKDSIRLDFLLEPEDMAIEEVVVFAGENPANPIVRGIIAQKDRNNYLKKPIFSAELYSKLEMDMVGVGTLITQNPLLKSFDFVFAHIDSTSEEKPFLPGYFAEELKQLYVIDGAITELPRARKVSEIGNESIIRMLSLIHERVDVYANWMPIMEKAFAGPFADAGFANYAYYLLDSAMLDGRKSYQLKFKPRRKQENTFTGVFWVDSLSFAVREIRMEKSPEVNINLLARVEVEAHFSYSQVGWVPQKEQLLLEYLIDEQAKLPGLIARKTNFYQNCSEQPPTESLVVPDARIFDPSTLGREENFWAQIRPEPLADREAGVYEMVDSIGQSTAFKRFKKVVYTLGSGYLPWGPVEFGPLASSFSNNFVEGRRIRFGIGSSLNWSKKWWLYGYSAYGQLDNRWKYGAHVHWQPSKRPWTTYKLSYKEDLELSFTEQGDINEDNFFAGIYRRDIPQKLLYTRQAMGYWEQDFAGGWTTSAFLRYRRLEPFTRNGLGFPFYFRSSTVEPGLHTVRTVEAELRLRWAPALIFLETNFSRSSIGSQDSRPSIEPFYIAGKYGQHTYYHHAGFRLSQWFNLPPAGWLRYHIHAGIITNTLPYLLLHTPAANETYLYVGNAFNTLSRYEFVSDTYLDALAVYHMDGFLFNRIPLFRKLKWREVFTFRMAYGSLRKKNQEANARNQYNPDYADYANNPLPGEGVYYGAFNKGPLFEVGAGVENIFKIIRIDATWRLNYLKNRYAVPLSLRGTLTFYF